MASSEEISEVFQKHTDHRLQLEELMQMLPRCFPEKPKDLLSDNIDDLVNFIKSVVTHETGSMVVSRQLVNIIMARLEGEPIEGASGGYAERCEPADAGLLKQALVKLTAVLQPRAISYPDQLAQMSFKLAGIYEREGNCKEAANCLKNINHDTTQRNVSESDKCEIYLRTARLYLDAEESEEAENMINRVSHILQNKERKDDELTIMFKALFARILDSRRRFLEAANRFYELSNCSMICVSDRKEALSSAITSILLAAPGAVRTRMLIMLYKDERSAQIESFKLLEKTYLCRIIKTQEIAAFESSLLPHQKMNEDGENIVTNVLLEHNVMAASRIYDTISLSSLASLLGLQSDEEAEAVASQMISDKRLDAEIDQIDAKITFKQANAIKRWDDNIKAMCEQVSKVYDAILSSHPQFVQSIESAL